jgi:hypothetical protein
MTPFLIDTQVRNLITDETARVVGLPDTFGAYPVIYDGETDIYWVSPHKLAVEVPYTRKWRHE